MSIFALLALFLLPVFPFSMLTNKFLSILKPKLFSAFIMIFYISGNTLFFFMDIDSEIVKFLALFTLFFYSFRLLGVRDLKFFVLYLYPVIASLSWLWYLAGGDVMESIGIKTPILLLFLYLYGFLSNKFGIVHQKSIRGLGNVMPRWSVLFILSLLGVTSSMLFLGYEFLEIELAKLPVFYGITLLLSWILINWGSIKVVEWLIYGEKREDMVYFDLSNFQMIFSILLVLISMAGFIFYSVKSLV